MNTEQMTTLKELVVEIIQAKRKEAYGRDSLNSLDEAVELAMNVAEAYSEIEFRIGVEVGKQLHRMILEVQELEGGRKLTKEEIEKEIETATEEELNNLIRWARSSEKYLFSMIADKTSFTNLVVERATRKIIYSTHVKWSKNESGDVELETLITKSNKTVTDKHMEALMSVSLKKEETANEEG